MAETKDEIGDNLKNLKENLEAKQAELKAASDKLESLFKPKLLKKGLLNGKPVNVTLTEQGNVIIVFRNNEEGEEYYKSIEQQK